MRTSPSTAGDGAVVVPDVLRPRAPGRVSIGEALAALTAVAAGVGAVWLVAHHNSGPEPGSPPLVLLVGWSFVGSGLVSGRARPDNRLGRVMIVTGFAWFAIFLTAARDPLLFTIGEAVQSVFLAGFAYLILSFPSGRLQGGLDRIVIVSAVGLVTVVELASLLFSDSSAVLCDGCPRNVLEVSRNDALASGLLQFQRVGGVLAAAGAAWLLVTRWRHASRPYRHAVAPVLWTGGATLLALAVSIANDVLDDPLGHTPKRLLFMVFAAVPVAVLFVFLQRRLSRGAVAGLVVELSGSSAATDLREALARTLGDPSLELAFWFPEGGRYVDKDGGAVALPSAGADRLATVVERDGEPVAALVHDSALQHNVELVESVCAAAGLALENERLQAELRARLAELRASRTRLVDATDAERRRIERDLHDGTQQRLVSIAMSLGLLESKLSGAPAETGPILCEARGELAAALEELRELTRGIHPTILAERGLAVALDELCRRAAIPTRLELVLTNRLPDQVETAAYFFVSEALTNAVKHAHASEARVDAVLDGRLLIVEVVDDGVGGAASGGGSGLRGLADRVEALGGRLSVSSPPGSGTVLRAEIPCA
ncbi:MAG: sensor histidine kinase [Gaiellaceae bacterium]